MVLLFKNVLNFFLFLKEGNFYHVIIKLEIFLSQQAAKTKNIKAQEEGRQQMPENEIGYFLLLSSILQEKLSHLIILSIFMSSVFQAKDFKAW